MNCFSTVEVLFIYKNKALSEILAPPSVVERCESFGMLMSHATLSGFSCQAVRKITLLGPLDTDDDFNIISRNVGKVSVINIAS
jgi:hypothetical protein